MCSVKAERRTFNFQRSTFNGSDPCRTPFPLVGGALQLAGHMFLRLLKAKIHRATVTFTDVNYHGSITIDSDLLKAAGLYPNQAVLAPASNTGTRCKPHITPGDPGGGASAITGPAARLTKVGNKVIVMAFVH